MDPPEASSWNPPELPGPWYWLVLAPASVCGKLGCALCWEGWLPAGLVQPLPQPWFLPPPPLTLLPAFHVTMTLSCSSWARQDGPAVTLLVSLLLLIQSPLEWSWEIGAGGADLNATDPPCSPSGPAPLPLLHLLSEEPFLSPSGHAFVALGQSACELSQPENSDVSIRETDVLCISCKWLTELEPAPAQAPQRVCYLPPERTADGGEAPPLVFEGSSRDLSET